MMAVSKEPVGIRTNWLTSVFRYRYLIILAWFGIATAGVFALGKLGPRLDYTYTTPGEVGFESNLKITQRFGIDPAFESELPLLRLPAGVTMSSPKGQDIAARAFYGVHRAGPLMVQDYANTHDPQFILDQGRATWALVSIPNPDYGPGSGIEERLDPALQAATPAGSHLTLTGFAQMLSNAGPNAGNLMEGLLFGAGLAFIVMVVVYGSAIAILPIVMALPSMLAAYLCVFCLTYVAHVSYFVNYMIVLLSLGISIDFSLMIVIRWREEREKGLPNADAVRAALLNGGRAVALSGLTAAVGLLSLTLLPVPFLRSIGYGGMIIPFVAVCVAVTLLPVGLILAGPALDRFSIWPRGSTTYSRAWEWWGLLILRHRWKAAVIGLLVLAVTSLPVLSMKTGEPLIGSLVQVGPAAEAFHHLRANGLPSGLDFPIYIVTHGGDAAAGEAKQIALATPGVHAVFSPATSDFRIAQDALLTAVPEFEGSSKEGKAIVSRLRERLSLLPGGAADVGGSTAEDISFTDAVYGTFPLLLTIVSLVTMAILVVALRSIVLAVKAVLLNVISLGSAYGFMVFFWQQGHGSNLIYGMPATDAIRAWVPSIVFASLFGLSMDYEVFVLSRIREEYDLSGSTQQAVVGGLARTGRLVTCAALILMVTFLSLSVDPNQIVKIQASTLAVGVIVDAVIIRTLLLPALVSLMGRWNWWLPSSLEKLLAGRRRASA